MTLERVERFGCKNKIAAFVLPVGYSFNLDGSMMYCTFAAVFIAQVYGIEMEFSQQLLMLLVLMITSKGIAGVHEPHWWSLPRLYRNSISRRQVCY